MTAVERMRRESGLTLVCYSSGKGQLNLWRQPFYQVGVATVRRGGATQHHVMSIFADSARTKMYGSLRERAGGSCRVQVTLF